LDKLDELGIAQNTLVVFTTDHGHFIGQHGLIAKGPFHYEDMIKVPLIVRQPDVVPAGKESSALQSLVDIAPTCLSFAGVKAPRYMTGLDRRNEWSGGEQMPRNNVIVEHHHQPTTIHMKTLVTDRYKLTVYFNREYGELFDLQEDPGEYNNQWDNPEYKERKAELTRELLFAMMGVEPMPMPRIYGA
ncbi:MAG: sulfatase-like hydrolase/transferase, partial [Sedimentisphaerales bacterium]|nr:sulfatase-like hydrolase/transferase [Sedimentisphaerales bacterium]